MEKQIVWHPHSVSRTEKELLNGHRSALLWFTGLSGAGKSTIAHAVEQKLYEMGVRTYVLDGDNVRHGLCSDLGFSEESRVENIRRIGEMSNLFVESATFVISAFISPYRRDRNRVRKLLGEGDFIEVFVNTSLEECVRRDVKGLYARAMSGEIKNFTGVSDPYEPPEEPEIELLAGEDDIETCALQVIQYLKENSYLEPPSD